MPIGGGKYDKETTELLLRLNAKGVFLMVSAADGSCEFGVAVTEPRLMLGLSEALVSAGVKMAMDMHGSSLPPFGGGWKDPNAH